MKISEFKATRSLIAGIILFTPGRSIAFAGTCGEGAAMRWRLTCTVVSKNTTRDLEYLYSGLKGVSLCFSFTNKGGRNDDDATILHNRRDGTAISPLSWFNVVRFQGGEVHNFVSWDGYEFRNSNAYIRMKGTLKVSDDWSKGIYVEQIYRKNTLVAELSSSCALDPFR